MHKLIVANYKMNGNREFYLAMMEKVNNLNLRDTKLILCPPFVYLYALQNMKKFVTLGAQDIAFSLRKKPTGQISPDMLKEFGVEYVLIGHFDVRDRDDFDMVICKIKSALNNDIIPIVCLRDSEINITKQIEEIAKNFSIDKIIFAYEPATSIGTGKAIGEKVLKKKVEEIRKTCEKFAKNTKVLYGGSINNENFKRYVGLVDGFVVGATSLDEKKFLDLILGVDNE